MARLRWGDDAPPDPGSARERLIDAAAACFRRNGVIKTTVEDVAAEARVSRATVYRYFADRDELILGVLTRDIGEFLTRLADVVDRQPTFADAIVESVVALMEAARADDNLAMLLAPETAGLTTSIAGGSDAVFALATGFFRPVFEKAIATGEFRDGVDIADGAEWALRIGLSLVSVEGPVARDGDALRRMVRTFLVPALAKPMRH